VTGITLAGVSSPRGRVQIPAWGAWWADVDLVEDVALSGAVALVVADVPLACTVVSGGAINGRAAYRVVGGAGGWGTTLLARGYADDAGVRVASVLADLARETGETVADASLTARLGSHYARAAGPAYVALAELSPRAWYVDAAGVTRIGARAVTTYAGDAPRVRIDQAGQIVELAVDEGLSTLVPGVVVDESTPATDVEWSWDGASLVARVWSGPRPSRRLDAWQRIYDALDARRAYRGVYEYRVVTQTGDALNLQPVRTASGMPDLVRVPWRPGVPGVRADVTLGELVVVAFLDSDPSRPVVIAHEAPGAPGWSPTLLEVGGTGGEFAALAGKVDANFAALYSLFTNWTPAPNDGGAALKLAWTTWLAGPPAHPAFGATGSSKVKVAL